MIDSLLTTIVEST